MMIVDDFITNDMGNYVIKNYYVIKLLRNKMVALLGRSIQYTTIRWVVAEVSVFLVLSLLELGSRGRRVAVLVHRWK
jgi:RNA polymerase-interacting CarD/CdnL/TRCF family regulator